MLQVLFHIVTYRQHHCKEKQDPTCCLAMHTYTQSSRPITWFDGILCDIIGCDKCCHHHLCKKETQGLSDCGSACSHNVRYLSLHTYTHMILLGRAWASPTLTCWTQAVSVCMYVCMYVCMCICIRTSYRICWITIVACENFENTLSIFLTAMFPKHAK